MDQEGSGETSRAARDTLARQGIAFDEERALVYVRKGDVETLRTFLDAGLRPDFSDDNGVPALTIAARLGHDGICRTLLAHGADPTALVDALKARAKPSKDPWDRFAQLSGLLTFTSTLIVAAVGWHFTNAYNERQQEAARQQGERDAGIRIQQARTSEMDTVVKLIPHLTQSEQAKKAALLAMSELATPKLAVQMAQLFGGVGSVEALETLAQQESPSSSAPGAVSALAQIASQSADGSASAATAASAALGGIFKGKERALAEVLSGGQFSCNAFIADLGSPAILTPAYCVDVKRPANYKVRLWDKKELAVTTVTVRGGMAQLQTAPLSNATALKLSDAYPAIGTTLLKVAFGVDVGKDGGGRSGLSVVAGKVGKTGVSGALFGPSPEADSDQFVSVSFAGGATRGGEGGGPMLDAAGAVSCIVYASSVGEPNTELCLSTRTLRADFGARPAAN